MVVFVTGAAGFVGSHLVSALLENGHEVRCLIEPGSQNASLQDKAAVCVEGDICDTELVDRLKEPLRGVDVVIHLAGLTQALTADQLTQVNGLGSETIARACADQPSPPVLVQVSSVAAAGPVELKRERRPDESPHPISDYGRSKLAGEIAVRRYAGQVPITIVRPGMVIGPGDRAGLSIFKGIQQSHCHFNTGWHSPPLSLIYIHDLVEVLQRLAQRGHRIDEKDAAHGGCYFACDRQHPSYAELGRMIRGELNRPWAPVVRLPYRFVWSCAKLIEWRSARTGKPAAFTVDKLREATASSWACSPESLYGDLQFQPAMPLQQQLRHTVDWYRQSGWL